MQGVDAVGFFYTSPWQQLAALVNALKSLWFQYREQFLLKSMYYCCMFLAYADRTIPKGGLEMKSIYKLFGQLAASAGLLGIMFAASASAMAASYNIILKTSGGAIQSCATGGFTFTKTTVGTFTTTSPSVALNGTTTTPCFGVTSNVTLNNGTLSVTVANVTVNGQDQGPNVVSINGNLSNGNANGSYTIHFLADKSFTITQKDGNADPQVGSGIYYIYNQNSVPEPEMLWLALAGLSALALSRRKRRRS